MEKNLDINFYRKFYNDLSNLNDNELKSDYMICCSTYFINIFLFK